MLLTSILTFLLIVGWLILESYSYVLIGRSVRRYLKRTGSNAWLILVPLGLLLAYFVVVFVVALF